MNKITQELVKQLFDYHDDGYLIWRKSLNRSIVIGVRAGSIQQNKKNNTQYYYVGFLHKVYKVSRIIFLWHHGYLPEVVDHEDRNSLNDKIKNLRPASSSQNNSNLTKRKKPCKSVYLGVVRDKKRWNALLQNNRICYNKCGFKTEEQAALAYNKLAVEHHKEFASLNIIKPKKNEI